MIDHNGLITYMIQYTRVGSSDMMSVNVNSGTTHTISGLVAYVDYSVTVAARTVNGTGPFSDAVIQRSGEDGKLNQKQLCYKRYGQSERSRKRGTGLFLTISLLYKIK